MALQLGALRDALLEAKVSEAAAARAAEELAGYDDRLNRIEARLEAFEARMESRLIAFEARTEKRFSEIELRFAHVDRRLDATNASVTLLRWMVGFNLALSVAVLLKLLTVH